MHDIKEIKQHPDVFDNSLYKRNIQPLSATIIEYDKKHRAAISELQTYNEDINRLTKEFVANKSEELRNRIREMKQNYCVLQEKVKTTEKQLNDILSEIPNILHDEVPYGKDENDNLLIKTNTITKINGKSHQELGIALGMMDFETATKIAGSRFVILKNKLAKLERALINFMMDIHVSNGYEEISPPLLVKEDALYGTGQLPKFKDDLFSVGNHYLIPTAEVSLTNIVRNKIVNSLPLRYVSATPCFRAEAGAAGKDTSGIIRQHQFYKVELVSITTMENMMTEHETITEHAENILELLKLPYQRKLLCSGDTGFSSMKTYDLEVWFPSQNRYREISSCSACGDFQARRMNAKFRNNGKLEYVATLNGSGVAVGRALAAIMENYQNADGSINVPEVLIPYMQCDKI